MKHIGIISVSVKDEKIGVSVSPENDVLGLTLITIMEYVRIGVQLK